MLAQSASRLTAAAESYGAVQLEQKVFVNMITMIIMITMITMIAIITIITIITITTIITLIIS